MRSRSLSRPLVVVSIISIGVVLLAFGLAGVAYADDPLDRQVNEIASGLNCPVCGGLSAAESSEPMAVQMRDLIRKKLSEGESRDAIFGYFVDRYGDSIRRDPLRRFLQSSIWWIAGGLMIGGVGLAILLTSRLKRSPEDPGVGGPRAIARAKDLEELAVDMGPEPRGKAQVYKPKRKKG